MSSIDTTPMIWEAPGNNASSGITNSQFGSAKAALIVSGSLSFIAFIIPGFRVGCRISGIQLSLSLQAAA